MRKVAVTDYTFPSLDVEAAILEPLGCEIAALRERRPPSELVPLVADAEAVLTQFAPVNAEVVAAMGRARVIVRYGVGVDNVDLEAARAKGIPVCNVPDYCIDEVADHALAFILAATRNVEPNSRGVKAGNWKLAVPLAAMRALKGLAVGVVGCGRIGREVIRRLLPFKARLLAFDPVLPPAEVQALGAEPVSFERLLAESDVVTLHCPSTPRTRRMMNGDAFGRMKPAALLVNLARGDLVDTAALVEALRSGRLGGAALDVCDPEPIPPDHPLLRMDNVVLASHVASASVQAARTLRETAALTVARALRGEPLTNVVNGVTGPAA